MYHLNLLQIMTNLMGEESEPKMKYQNLVESFNKRAENLFNTFEINFDKKILLLKINEHIIKEIKEL